MEQTVDQAFAEYVISSGSLTELGKLNNEIDAQIRESKMVLRDIVNSDKFTDDCNNYGCTDEITRHEQMSKFLEADKPLLLLPDMDKLYDSEVDIEQSILRNQSTLEQLKKKVIPATPKTNIHYNCEILNDLKPYEASLELFRKKLLNIQKLKTDGQSMRNMELEEKLQLMCLEVQNFSKMIQAKSKLVLHNGIEIDTTEKSVSLEYDDTIRNILDQINELTFLLGNN